MKPIILQNSIMQNERNTFPGNAFLAATFVLRYVLVIKWYIFRRHASILNTQRCTCTHILYMCLRIWPYKKFSFPHPHAHASKQQPRHSIQSSSFHPPPPDSYWRAFITFDKRLIRCFVASPRVACIGFTPSVTVTSRMRWVENGQCKIAHCSDGLWGMHGPVWHTRSTATCCNFQGCLCSNGNRRLFRLLRVCQGVGQGVGHFIELNGARWFLILRWYRSRGSWRGTRTGMNVTAKFVNEFVETSDIVRIDIFRERERGRCDIVCDDWKENFKFEVSKFWHEWLTIIAITFIMDRKKRLRYPHTPNEAAMDCKRRREEPCII